MSTSEEMIDRPEHAEARWLMKDVRAIVHLNAPILEKDAGMQNHFAAVLAATGETIREKLEDLCVYVLELKQKCIVALARTMPPEHSQLGEKEQEPARRRMQILSTATSVLGGLVDAICKIAEKYLASPLDVEVLLAATAERYESVRSSNRVGERGLGGFGF